MTAADEGRQFLPLILEDDALDRDLDEMEDHEIEVWLEELGYEWDEEKEAWIAND